MDKSAASPPPSPRKGKPAPGHLRPSRVIARWWWLALIMIACVVGIAYKLPAWFSMRGPLYESAALLEVKPIPYFDHSVHVPATKATPAGTGSAVGKSNFIATQEAIIQSPVTLQLALEQKELLNRLGGNEMIAEERMKKSLTVRWEYGTDLIEVIFRDEDPLLAYDAVSAIYQSYTKRRTELEMEIRDKQLKAIRVDLKNQEDLVAEMRQRLMNITEKLGVLMTEVAPTSDSIAKMADLRAMAEKDFYLAKKDIEELKLQITKLEDLDVEELIRRVSNMPVNGFPDVYIKYVKAQDEIEALRVTGISEKHPSIQQKNKALDKLQESLLKRATSVQRDLKARQNMLEKRVERMREVLSGSGSSDKADNFRRFTAAREEYQTGYSNLESLQNRYARLSTKMPTPMINHIVHQEPKRPTQPVTKGREFFTTLFSIVSLPIAAIAAIVLIYLAEAIFPRRMKV